jgi:putative transposase
VTYRLEDAIPAGVIQEFLYERNKWLLHRGINPKYLTAERAEWKSTVGRLTKADQMLYERTMANRLNKYLDAGHGSCALKRPELAEIVANALTFFHRQRVLTGDYVVMPNHVHVLLRPINGFELEDILHSVKSYTANKINRILGTAGKFWMRESYDHIVRDSEQLEAYQGYISSNPGKAQLAVGEYTLRNATYKLE